MLHFLQVLCLTVYQWWVKVGESASRESILDKSVLPFVGHVFVSRYEERCMSGGRVGDGITGQIVQRQKVKFKGSNGVVGDGLPR